MIPIIVDGAKLQIILVGRGPALDKRLAWLVEGGADRLTVFCDRPSPALADHPDLVAQLPTGADLALADLIWITGLPHAEALPLAEAARAAGTLVNVEDDPVFCDFHTPALVRRGDLLISVSTAGKSPGLAQRLKAWLEAQLAADWGERLEVLAHKRTAWRRRPRSLEQLNDLTGATIEAKGWLGRRGKEAA